MKCPRCGKENCHYVTNTRVSSSPFGMSEACCGFLFLGPLGLLCGLCGSETTSATDEYWICEDCGKKFRPDGLLSELNSILNQKITFYYDDSSKYLDKKSDRKVKAINEAFDKPDENDEFICKVLIRSEDFEKSKKVFHGIIRQIPDGEMVLLAYSGNSDKMVLTWDFICLSDTAIKYGDLTAISVFQKKIYFNQSCFTCDSEKEVIQLLGLLKNMFPDKETIEYEDYEGLLKRLQSLPEQKYTNESHFSSQTEYAEYICQLHSIKIEEYRGQHPTEFNKFQAMKEEKEERENELYKRGLLIGVAIGIISIAIWGIWMALFVLIMAEIIILLGVAIYVSTEKWNSYKKILPDKLSDLIKEADRTSAFKTGKVKPEDYSGDFQEIHAQTRNKEDEEPILGIVEKGTLDEKQTEGESSEFISNVSEKKIYKQGVPNFDTNSRLDSDYIKKCRHCGADIDDDWVVCPFCEHEINGRGGDRCSVQSVEKS